MAIPQYAMATPQYAISYTAMCYNFQIFAIYDILPLPGLIFEICQV